MLNAAVWCGSSIFLVIGLPALFSPELKRLLTAAGVGFAAESVVARYFVLQYWCGGIALAHLLAEWLYCGRPLWRLNLGLLVVILSLGLAGRYVGPAENARSAPHQVFWRDERTATARRQGIRGLARGVRSGQSAGHWGVGLVPLAGEQGAGTAAFAQF